MCGIAGYIGSEEIPEDRISRCLDLMRRRGPDANGFFRHLHSSGQRVYLLHTRLKIIDLEARANQPFHEGTRVLVFNGEIYNYLELKNQLISEGARFHTSSDTEVLMHLLGKEGEKGLDRCEGMWSFAHYEKVSGTLLLSRDRFGEKPLYLYSEGKNHFFGSEVKFIHALLGRKLEIQTDHLYRYMVNGYKSLYKKKTGFFRGVEEVRAGHTLALGPAGREERRYWEPKFSPDPTLTYPDVVSQVKESLIRAVKIRLRADVPLAFCMSGGVDSNSLISIAKRVFQFDVHGFTIVNHDSRYDEREMVDQVVAELGLKHTAIPVDVNDFLAKLRTLIVQHDAPVYTINYFAQWRLMESIASQGYKISLSGTAADELFSGYYDHHLAYLRTVQGDKELHASSLTAWNRYIKPIVRNPFLGNPDLFIDRPDFRDHIYLNSDEFSKYLRRSWSEPFTERRFTDDLLRNRMMNELFEETTPVILHEDDLNAMYYSIENRSPFLDRELFELCFRIPSQYLVRDGFAKAILRDAMSGIVPESVLRNRRKVGFNAPITSFLDLRDPKVKSYLLDQSPIYEHVHREKIERLVRGNEFQESESKFLFYFITSKMFLEEFGQ